MNINLQVKIDSPELMTAILLLAEAVPKLLLSSFYVLDHGESVDLISPVAEVKEVEVCLCQSNLSMIEE